jgi:hypothetical protein
MDEILIEDYFMDGCVILMIFFLVWTPYVSLYVYGIPKSFIVYSRVLSSALGFYVFYS